METPLVSVIIPTYNRVHLVGRAIESVLAQTYRSLEIIVVNNGSLDDTAKVLQGYLSDKRVQIITLEKNRGVYGAYNVALPLVRGKYATFLFDDDTFLPDAIEVLVYKAEELGPSVGMICGNCVDPTSGVLTGTGIYEERLVTFEDAMRGNIRGEYSGIWRMDVFGKRRFDEELLGGEGLIWYDLYRYTNGYYINRPVRYYYRYGADSISSIPRFDSLSVKRAAHTYNMYIEKFGQDMLRLAPKNYVYWLRLAAEWNILNHERQRAIAQLWDAFHIVPSLRTLIPMLLIVTPRIIVKYFIAGRGMLRRWVNNISLH